LKKTKLTFIILIILVLFVNTSILYSCDLSSEFTIVVAGSTSVQPFAEILAEEFMKNYYSESDIDIQGGGSSAGFQAVTEGTADLGMSSRNLKPSEEEQGYYVFEIAKDGLAIIVHPENPIVSLTLEQVRGIYKGEIIYWSDLTDWSDVGSRDAKIHIITREEGSGSRGAFEEAVMDGKRISPKAMVQDSNGQVRQLVSNDRNSIGFISLGLVESEDNFGKVRFKNDVKAVNLDGIAPTLENVINESYTLHRPFLFFTKDEPSGLLAQFIGFTLSLEGQDILIKEGLVGGDDAHNQPYADWLAKNFNDVDYEP